MRVLLIQVDGKWPNLALMKLSAWHKSQGDEVFMGSCKTPDLVYISCIFSWNQAKAFGMAKFYPDAEVVFGGVGLDLKSELPHDVEHIMPDYNLYDSDYSMGFSSRGCIRDCPWCIVPEKEGWIREHASITEFLHPDHKKLLLFDNNFPASPDCISKLEFLADWGGKVISTKASTSASSMRMWLSFSLRSVTTTPTSMSDGCTSAMTRAGWKSRWSRA